MLNYSRFRRYMLIKTSYPFAAIQRIYPMKAAGIVHLYPMYRIMILGRNKHDMTKAPYKTAEFIVPIPSSKCKLLWSLLKPYNDHND